MLTTSIVTGVLALLAFSPAYAQCNDDHMKQMDVMIAQMTNTTKKTEATAALDMSKAAIKKGDTAECMEHMVEAIRAMVAGDNGL